MGKKLFEGLKIAEFAWVIVGPSSSRYLAEHGATVIRIESHLRPETLRFLSPYPEGKPGLNKSMYFGKFNSNKYSLSLNMNHPQGLEVAWKLIKWCDIMTESFTPDIMTKWGLDYSKVSQVRPDIIYLSTCMQGKSGPHSRVAGYGTMLTGLAGIDDLSGWPDRPPSPPWDAYTDTICPRFNAAALIAALLYRHRTGKGQLVEQSQYESSLQFISPVIMDYFTNHHIATRNGNRLDYAAPHGVFPCQGDDRWMAIAVFNDEEWQKLCQAMGQPAWSLEDKYSTLDNRKQHETELEVHLAEWTSSFKAEELEAALQSAGVPSHRVSKSQDLFTDEQLKHRQFFTWLEHSEMGKVPYEPQSTYIMSKTPREIHQPSPCLGEHNLYVLKEVLGYSEEEIGNFISEGAVTF
jgi:benzylsuccinate CoA-transferase BbsF subunit